ncbi:calcium-transporting ATPase 4, endoplasmic reticulum-type-like [Silene latifolia]|uniref:calcium-transporting ATPase 4, endoplasmic reticulum-type-like n=1 Tax=Silene latifolia TaxID=37657 RepID=UPI003D76D2AE
MRYKFCSNAFEILKLGKCGDSFSPWTKDVKECEEKYGVSRDVSLSSEDVEKRQRVYGLNELDKHKGGLVLRLILDQFNDTLVRILLCSAVVSFVLKALEALKEIQSEHATVIRDGKKDTSLLVKEFIPRDIVELRVGDKVPTDMRVFTLNTSTLRFKQGPLTGESGAVSKTMKPVSEDTDSQGKKCMVFVGTMIVNGNCIFLVTYTGIGTETWKIPQNLLVLFGIQTQSRWKNASPVVAQTQEQVQYLDQEQVILVPL